MTTATLATRPSQRGRGPSLVAAWVFIAVAALGIAWSCSSTKPIDRLTIVNRTEFDVEVQVSNAKKQGWQILGRATNESSTLNELVTDEGATWVFQFHYGGKLVAEFPVARETLARYNWHLEVPASVARTMQRLGFEPPPD